MEPSGSGPQNTQSDGPITRSWFKIPTQTQDKDGYGFTLVLYDQIVKGVIPYTVRFDIPIYKYSGKKIGSNVTNAWREFESICANNVNIATNLSTGLQSCKNVIRSEKQDWKLSDVPHKQLFREEDFGGWNEKYKELSKEFWAPKATTTVTIHTCIPNKAPLPSNVGMPSYVQAQERETRESSYSSDYSSHIDMGAPTVDKSRLETVDSSSSDW